MKLSHVGPDGRARMVNVGDKAMTKRRAAAEGIIRMTPAAFALVEHGAGPKGDALATAELAGVMATKRTSELVPLCHMVPLDHVDVYAALEPDLPGVRVRATVECTGRTGVEMEALTAVSVALLALYDMVKAVDRSMEIAGIHVVEKSGGQSGDWHRAERRDG